MTKYLVSFDNVAAGNSYSIQQTLPKLLKWHEDLPCVTIM